MEKLHLAVVKGKEVGVGTLFPLPECLANGSESYKNEN
jgi:hypothetical protein